MIEARRARILRPWRIAFILFAVLLTIGTHWPKLQLAAQVPAGDKTIHLLTFGTATILLWLTGWFRSRWLVVAIVLAWAALDEVSQGIPILKRWVSWQDLLSNELGVLAAGAWLWALRPVGGTVNRARLRGQQFVFEEMFAHRRIWIEALAIMVVMAIVTVAIVMALEAETARRALLALAALALVAASLAIWRERNRHARRAAERMPCLSCGATLRAMIERPPRGGGEGTGFAAVAIGCPMCGTNNEAQQWRAGVAPPRVLVLRTALPQLLLGAGAIALIFGLIALTPAAYAWLIGRPGTRHGAASLARLIGQAPDELVLSIDLAALLLLFAVLMWFYRRGIARFYDQAIICRRCGHDLRGTPTDETGRGACGECGMEFVRDSPQRHRDIEGKRD